MLASTFLLALAANAVVGAVAAPWRALDVRVRHESATSAEVANLAAEQTAFAATEGGSSKPSKTRTKSHSQAESSPSSLPYPQTSSKPAAKAPTSTSHSPAPSPPPSGPSVVYVTATGPPTQTGIANGAVIIFPRASNYWVIKEVDVVQWEPPLVRPANIRLTNGYEQAPDFDLATDVPVGFKQMAFSVFEPAKPGPGYILVMTDAANGTVISESEPFEIKAFGASPVIPPPFTAETAAVDAPAGSGAGRRASNPGTWLSVVAVLAGGMAGMVMV